MKKQLYTLLKLALIPAVLIFSVITAYSQTGFPIHSSSSVINYGGDTIKTTGNILANKMGIGTTSPQYPLDVTGTIHATNLSIANGTFGGLTINGTTNSIANVASGSPSLNFSNTGISTTGALTAGSIQTTSFATDSMKISNILPSPGDSLVRIGEGGSIYFQPLLPGCVTGRFPHYYPAVADKIMTNCQGIAFGGLANFSNIYIGIGTASPGYNLDVNGVVHVNTFEIIGSVASTPNTYSPTNLTGYSLYAAGGILTEKVKIALNGGSDWSDYVFANTYKLSSLQDVETFVKQNNHLPDVPSSDEVKKDGIDVASMDAILLKKIEELTLYAIEQNKKVSNQEEEIKVLKAELQELKNGKK